MMPLVSVVMSVFNGERYVASAIESIINQSYENIEFIIINDGSTDDTSSIIHSYRSAKIRLVERGNRGLIESLNEGFRLARGDYIARQDADDISDLRRIELQVQFLQSNPAVCLLGSNAKRIDKNGQELDIIVQPETVSANYFYHANPFVHGAVMLRRRILAEFETWYSKEMLYIEDYDFFWRIVLSHSSRNLQQCLYFYREHDESISSKKVERQIVNVYLRRSIARGEISSLSERELSHKKKRTMMAKVENNIGHRFLRQSQRGRGTGTYLRSALRNLSVKSFIFFILSLVSPRLLLKIISDPRASLVSNSPPVQNSKY